MISGLYYQTIVRNVFSGETEFYIIPDSGYNIETKNGLLRCRGKIGIIVKNMPIELEGNYKNNEYIVSSSRIPTCSKESTFRLLNYIDDSITPHQKEVIANTVNNDLLGFMDEAEKRNILIKALSSKKTLLDLANGTASNETAAHFNKIVTIVDKIIITTEKLLNQEELVRQLMIYGVDIGKIEMLQVQFHNKVVDIFREDMCNMSLAYAITIHKSQGSEFDEVYIILQDSVSSMLTRRLLYTSVTRARKKVVVYDVNDCINKAISNTNDNFRKTGWKNIKNIFAKNFHI